ncbi:GAF domain-containing sensor histidine kinase [Halalkalicoccus salilacus]|uniref:GAF domain-containing sensor histidine kinase n=1 Tax=Halalkalicoccus salilacus TaxID=3117459 RepID=UPI00300F4152
MGDHRSPSESDSPEDLLRTALDTFDDPFFVVDDDWRFIYVNDPARSFLAQSRGRELTVGEIEGLHLREVIPEAVGIPFYERYHEAMETGEAVTAEEYYEPLNSWFEVRAYPSETGLSVYLRDVTERHRRGEPIQERERVLREMYEVTADTERSFTEQVDALLEIGCDVLKTEFATLSRIRGDDYEFEIVRTPDGSIQPGDEVPLSATNCERTAATERTLVLADVVRDAPDLAEKAGYTEWGIACYLGAPVIVDGEVYGTFCFYDREPRAEEFSEWEVTLVDLVSQWLSYELTHQRTQEQLKRKNAQLEEFASLVSHDLRNPLNILDGWLELAQQSGEADHFDRCYRAIDRMDVLINELLALARAGERITDLQTVELADLVEESWQTVATANATLTVDTEQTIRADVNGLRQLFENLFRNGMEHGTTASRARSDAAFHESSNGRSGFGDQTEHRTDRVCFTVGDLDDGFYVEDDGPGIPPEERERVFEIGYSTAQGGTGFGLSIVRQIADAHGWDVSVVDGRDGGARFEFTRIERIHPAPAG